MLLQWNVILAVEGWGKAALCKPDTSEGQRSGSASPQGRHWGHGVATAMASELGWPGSLKINEVN